MSEQQPDKTIQPHPSLEQAWKLFALYDDNAKHQQKNSNRFQLWILILGVLSTILVLSQTQWIKDTVPEKSLLYKAFQWAIIIMPIAISVLVAASNRFKSGNKWVLLRAGAEAIKREIYKYRILTGIYVKQPEDEFKYKEELVNKISQLNTQLMQTEVNLAALKPYPETGPIPPEMYGASDKDDGFSFLPPEGYLKIRLGDQVNYYQSKVRKLGMRLKILQWLIYIIGGLGTLLAAVGLELWVALTTTIVGTFSTYMEYQQTENSLMIYNQAATSLTNIQAWWTALPDKKRKDPENIKKLVDNTEKVFQTELKGWVQQMEDALAELQEKQTEQQEEPK
jgi:hypothetical protein